jgi:spore coat polysaccharide biosynthesis predicted glycosyltransferase SpsG/RimJ/RimL family protein N-acetyltransferase
MKVSILTEGFQNTGYGHITRCLSLCQAFEVKNIFPSFYINGDEPSILFVPDKQIKLIDWLQNPTKLIGDIKNSDVLIIDSYLAGREHYDNFSKLASLSLFIDDNLRIDYPNGIILNGTINAESFIYKKEPKKAFLLGSKYIPIRKEFWSLAPRKINQELNSILITFGAQDVKNLTTPTIKSIREHFPDLKINVVNATEKTSTDKMILDDKIIFWNRVDADKMVELMLNSDAAISAAGQTLYELAATGTPTIAVAVAENQKYNITGWKKCGFLIDPIYHSDINLHRKIIGQLETMRSIKIRKKLSSSGKVKIDGRGSQNVINFIIDQYCRDNNFYLRKAVESDSNIVLELSNDPTVRSQSINTNRIKIEVHQEWFAKKIIDPGYLYLLAFTNKDEFIGQVRFEIENNEAIVSISISQKFRGKGFSKKILKRACSKVFSEMKVDSIIAYIKPENAASIKGFLSAGFVYSTDQLINNINFTKYIFGK